MAAEQAALAVESGMDGLVAPTRPSEIVTLKVRTTMEDLDAGRYRRASPIAAPDPTPPRRKRGRPRKYPIGTSRADRLRLARQESQLDLQPGRRSVQQSRPEPQPQPHPAPQGQEEEEEEPQKQEQQHHRYDNGELSFSFQSVSDYTFPLLVHSISSLNRSKAAPADAETAPIVQSNAQTMSTTQLPRPSDVSDSNIDNTSIVSAARPTMQESTRRLQRRTDPMTPGYWHDRTLADQAMRSDNIDFKMLCLLLIRGRMQNEVPVPLVLTEEPQISHEQWTGTDARTCPPRRLQPYWDHLLDEAVAKGRLWRQLRRYKKEEKRKAAGWAVWDFRMRKKERGSFVDDSNVHGGGWVTRAPGDDGKILKVLKLGYRRERI